MKTRLDLNTHHDVIAKINHVQEPVSSFDHSERHSLESEGTIA